MNIWATTSAIDFGMNGLRGEDVAEGTVIDV